MCIYTCIYIYTFTYVYMIIYVYIYVRIYVFKNIYKFIVGDHFLAFFQLLISFYYILISNIEYI